MTNKLTIKGLWWKALAFLLLLYAVIFGFFVPVPDTMIGASLRNVFYHVGMWFGMTAMLTTSFIFSIRYLRGFNEKEDLVAVEASNTESFIIEPIITTCSDRSKSCGFELWYTIFRSTPSWSSI